MKHARTQIRNAVNGMGAAPITVNMNVQTPDVQSFRQSQGQLAADMARSIDRARRNL